MTYVYGFRILHVLSFALALTACGDDDNFRPEQAAKDAAWTSFLQPLSAAPGCYAPAPHQPVPENVSDAYARQAENDSRWRHRRALSCISRYSAIVDAVRAAPDERRWQVTHAGIEFLVESSSHQGNQEGFFRVSAEELPEDKDPECPVPSEVVGAFTSDFTYVEQSGLFLVWNEDSVTATLPLGIIELMMFYRGCDPETKVSSGHLVPYNQEGSIRCWSEEGSFVPCAPDVDGWPLNDDEPPAQP